MFSPALRHALVAGSVLLGLASGLRRSRDGAVRVTARFFSVEQGGLGRLRH